MGHDCFFYMGSNYHNMVECNYSGWKINRAQHLDCTLYKN